MYDFSAAPWQVWGGKPGIQPAPSPPPASKAKAGYGPLPHPPPLEDTLTVSDAWLLFGIPKKRGSREDVKARYLEFVFEHHPDRAADPIEAAKQLVRANLAWALLQRHCRW